MEILLVNKSLVVFEHSYTGEMLRAKWQTFPNGKSKEEQKLHQRWIRMIPPKNVDSPDVGHMVCSKHFIGDWKDLFE